MGPTLYYFSMFSAFFGPTQSPYPQMSAFLLAHLKYDVRFSEIPLIFFLYLQHVRPKLQVGLILLKKPLQHIHFNSDLFPQILFPLSITGFPRNSLGKSRQLLIGLLIYFFIYQNLQANLLKIQIKMLPKKKLRMTSLTMTMMTILNPLKQWKLQSNVMLPMSEILLRLCQRINHTRKDQLHFQHCQTSLSIKSNMNIPRSHVF